jgi:hypothetical protein
MRWMPRTAAVSAAAFVAMESLAWWIALQALATTLTRDGYATMLARLLQSKVTAEVDAEQLQRAITAARDAAAHASAGPPFPVVLAAAGGAFLLVRWLTRQRMPAAATAVIGVAASLVAFQLLVRASMVIDGHIWSSVPLLQGEVADRVGDADLVAYVAAPGGGLTVRGATSAVSMGLGLLWVRFLIAGRGAVTYERVLRSFGAGFAALLALTAWLAIGASVDVFPFVPLYFVAGVAALALAQAARARPEAESGARLEPWVTSLAAVLGGMALITGVFSFLALVDGGRLLTPVIDAIVWVLGRLAWLVLYPFAVVMQWIVTLLIGGRTLHMEQFNIDLTPIQPPTSPDAHPPVFPSWLAFLLRAAAMLVVAWALYRIGRVLFAARSRMSALSQGVEVRLRSGEEVESGLLSGLFRRRRNEDTIAGDWLRRHAVYELFARLVRTAHERGVERPAGSTPIEFAHEAGLRLDAPVFEPIGAAFDEVRYGRHLPDGAQIETLEQSLRAWEQTHPRGTAEPPAG